MTRILTIGDLHYSEQDVRMPELFNVRIVEMLKEDDYDCCVLLGDVFHKFKRIDQPALKLVYKLVENISEICPLFILVGNHDYINASQYLTDDHSLLPFKKWKNVRVIDKPKKFKFDHCRVVFCPYVPKGRFLEAIDTVKGWERCDMIFAHQEFKGAKMGMHESIDGDFWSDEFPPVVSGHIHDRQKIGNIHYTGTPYDIGFDSGKKRYVCSITFKRDEYTIDYLPTLMPRKRIVKMSHEEAATWVPPAGDHYFKLKVVSSRDEYRTFCKSDHAQMLKSCGVKLFHISDSDAKLNDYLEKRKGQVGGVETYSDIFKSLVEKEGLSGLLAKMG